jgi:hypothetical protein
MSCVAAYLASQSDPEMIAIFGFARLQSTDPLTYLVIGLKGYVVCADIPEDDLALDDGAEATKSYVPYVSGESDKMEENGGSSYDWINACAASGDIAAASIIPIIAVKFVACFVLYKRVDTEADGWVWKFLGLGVELLSAVMILNMLLNFSLSCLMELPTGEFFIPDGTAPAANVLDDAAAAAYAYAADDPGESYPVDFNMPYTSFLFTILSGGSSLFIAYVHWRTPTWNSELFENDW